MPLAFGDVTPSALTLMITPHGAVYNSTPGRLLTMSLTSPVAWELLAGGGPGLVHLCVRPPVLRAERMLLKDVSSSQVRDGRLIQMTPLLSDCSRSPWHLVLGDRSAGGGLRLPPAEAAACRWPAPGARKPPLLRYCSPWPQLHPPSPLGREQAGLFSLSLHLNPTPNLTINVCVLRLHFLL